jgi:hypothetical protein
MRVDNQQSRGVVIARLRSSVRKPSSPTSSSPPIDLSLTHGRSGSNLLSGINLRKIHKNSSKNSYLSNYNSKSSDSCAKNLRITSSFFLCIHITHVCCILLIDCMYLLHGRKRYVGTVVRGYSRPSLRGVPAVLRGPTRQVSVNMLHL